MIANDYHLELARAELAKWRGSLVEIEAVLARLPGSIAAQVKACRPAEIRRRIVQLEAEIREYGTARQSIA